LGGRLQPRRGRIPAAQVDRARRGEQGEPAARDKQPPVFRKGFPCSEEPRDVAQVQPYPRQQLCRRCARVGDGHVIDGLLDPVESRAAHLTGRD
jgi:hypothetical protein